MWTEREDVNPKPAPASPAAEPAAGARGGHGNRVCSPNVHLTSVVSFNPQQKRAGHKFPQNSGGNRDAEGTLTSPGRTAAEQGAGAPRARRPVPPSSRGRCAAAARPGPGQPEPLRVEPTARRSLMSFLLEENVSSGCACSTTRGCWRVHSPSRDAGSMALKTFVCQTNAIYFKNCAIFSFQ